MTTPCIPRLAVGIVFGLGSPALQAQEVIDLPSRDSRIEPEFEEVYRVGVLEGEPWEMFAHVNSVAFDAQGNLYVFDGDMGMGLLSSGSLRVVVFDAAGGFLREFGSAGGGPGEFNRPVSFTVLRDGTTVVSDAGHRAYQIFDASGTFERMVRTGAAPGGAVVSATLLPDPRGGAVFSGAFGGNPGVTVASAGGGPVALPTSRPVVRVGLDGEAVKEDTVVHGWLPPRTGLNDRLSNDVPADLRPMFAQLSVPTVFEPQLLVGVLPDGGIVHSDSSAYALKVTPPGRMEAARILLRPFPPEPVTPSVQQEYEERRSAARGAGGTAGYNMMVRGRGPRRGNIPPVSGSFRIEERYYREVPVLRSLAATWDGRIWVQRRGDEPLSDGPIDILSPEGEYVGTYRTGATEMPDAFGPDGRAAFIELDDFDVASVVVRRLPTDVR